MATSSYIQGKTFSRQAILFAGLSNDRQSQVQNPAAHKRLYKFRDDQISVALYWGTFLNIRHFELTFCPNRILVLAEFL